MPPNGSVVVAVDSTNDTLTFYNPDTVELTGSVDVGFAPVSVAVSNDFAYVANQRSNNVSVVSLATRQVVATIAVGKAPTHVVLSPNGTRLYVWNRGDGIVTSVDTATNLPVAARFLTTVALAGIAISNDGDADDSDEVIHFAKTKEHGIDGGGRLPHDEGQDANGLGHIERAGSGTLDAFSTVEIGSMTDTGFSSNGRSAPANFSGSPPTPAVTSTNPPTFTTPTGAIPNLLAPVAIHPTNGLAYVASTGASPNGPLRFDTNHQGLVSVINLTTGSEVIAPQTNPLVRQTAPLNMNLGVNLATTPVPRLYFSNPVAMSWRPDGSDAWVVNQNTNCLVRLTVDANGVPTISAPLVAGPSSIVRVDLEASGAGQIAGRGANGIVINPAGTRAFVSCYISRSVTMVDITNPTAPAIAGTAQSAPLPAAGTQEALALRGEELFHSARGRMSSEGWGSCSNCHPGGQSDNVTWMFPDGPRQTPSLAGAFAKGNPTDRRIFNWSATFDEIEDFERHTRDVTGGQGAIDDDRRILAIGGATAGGDTGGIEEFHQFTGAVSPTSDLAGGANFPSLLSRRDHCSVTLRDGRVLIFGGRSGPDAGTLVTGADLVVEFNPDTNAFRSCNSAGFTPRHSCSAANVQTPDGERICVIGGYPDTPNTTMPIATVEEFNPLTETWRTCASLPQAVAQAACCIFGGQRSSEPRELVEVFSGNKGTEAVPSLLNGTSPAFNIQRFQPDAAGPGTWSTFFLSSLTARHGHGMASIIKETIARIYIFGGYNASGTLLSTVQEYGGGVGAPIFFSGTKTAMQVALANFGIHAAQGTSQFYIIGGKDASGNPTGNIHEYSANTNGPVAGSAGSPSGAWVTRGTLATPRHSLVLSTPPSVRPLLPHSNAGRSEDWDAIEAYVKTIRPLPAPVAATDPAVISGRALFGQVGLVQAGFSCATCHGGPKWTRSTVDFSSPPSADSNTGMGDERVLGLEIRQTITQPANSVLVNVGTFTTVGRVNEIRPSGVDIRTNNSALGSIYNIPSLLDVHATAPYFHHGIAQTLDDVLNGAWDGSGGVRHHFVNNATNRANLVAFLRSIDDTTAPVAFSNAAPAVVTGTAVDAPNRVFQFNATGTPNQVYTVEKSADLVNWQTHRSYNTGAAGAFTVFDLYFIHYFPYQFYRIGIR